MNILSGIHSRAELLSVPQEQIPALCEEIRSFLLEKVSKTGGHLASNLGAVELTVALHRVYDPMRDRILFDVGHQAYVHKMLTGRMDGFDRLRQFGGISGFPKPCESEADPFLAGHASESVSLALGMARARTLTAENYDVVAVIGDGALTGGLSFEGLSDAGESGEPIVIVLNDNGMSINQSVGGVATLLRRARTRASYLRFKRLYRRIMKCFPRLYKKLHSFKEFIKNRLIPSGIFDELGFAYVGPVNGHDEAALEIVLRWARELRVPAVVHVVTKKGKGYQPAEDNPELYHGVAPFDPEHGIVPAVGNDFSTCFGKTAVALAEEDETVCAVTAAMESGTGLETFATKYPERFFELGIAEEHAVSLCAGMAKQGLKPIFAVYSTFLQRSYDMLLEDAGLMNQHIVFGVDRAGLVGSDGVTHHGSFDIAYLGTIPNMRLYAPSSYAELNTMLRRAVSEETGPVALRYPRGHEGTFSADTAGENAVILRPGLHLTLVTYGILVNEALSAAELLSKQGIEAEIVKINRLIPFAPEVSLHSLAKTGRLLTLEDSCRAGSIGTALLSAAAESGVSVHAVKRLDLRNGVIAHGSVPELYHSLGMDTEGIITAATEIVYEKDQTGSACI